MLRKIFITVFTVLSMGFASGPMAATIHERVEIAQDRIERGMRSGHLTRSEGRRLREELNQVRHHESRARSDGRLDRRERDRLDRELDRLERHIHRYMNNDIRR